MALKFSANISTLFTEYEFLDRFQKAKDSGFDCIEIQSPFDFKPADILDAKQDLKCDLVNIICGDETPYGCAALMNRSHEFYESTKTVLPFYFSLNYKKLHILSGERDATLDLDDQIGVMVSTLKHLVASEYLDEYCLTAVIEPICADVIPNYFLNSFDMAVDIIRAVGNKRIKLLLDIYHLHKITGDVRANLDKYYPFAGHIQVSQDPGRGPPFPDGNIDYRFVFDYLRTHGHSDYIGLEYGPIQGSTEDSLGWIQQYK